MDVISISDSTDGSVGLRSLLLRYAAKSPPAKPNEDSPLTEEPISLSSESTERCPVTWRTKQKKKINLMKNMMREKTPCATAKVESWLTQNNTKSNFSTLQLEALDGSTVLRLEPLKRGGSILIRHDYNKDLISYMKAKPCYVSRKIFSAKKTEGEVICLDSDNCSNKSASEEGVEKNRRIDCGNKDPSNDDDDDDDDGEKSVGKRKVKLKAAGVPLSPESQKKNELCSYLQLMDMNCTDKKIGSIIQNRRSVRVQNLNMLSERKKLEKELRCETKETVTVYEIHESDKELAKKSFAELKINVSRENNESDKSANSKANVSSVEKNNFLCVSALPKGIWERPVDFDEVMKAFIDTEGIPVVKRNGARFKLNNSPTKPEKVSPRNLRKYRNLRRSAQKLQVIKKKETNRSNLLKRKQSSSSVVKRRKLLSKKLKKQRKAPPNNTNNAIVISQKLTNMPVQIPVSKDVKIGGNPQPQNLNGERNVPPSAPQQKKRESTSKRKSEERRRSKENKALSKSVKAFREKSFSIIDLSHQHEYTSSDTLLDHNYASKTEIDKNYIMNVIVGQPFVANANQQDTVQKPQVQIAPSNLKINGQQPPAIEEEGKVVKKNRLTVSPIQFNYTDFSDELNMTVKNKMFDDKINDKPPVNIFEDSAYLQSPVKVSNTCIKEILDKLEDDSNNEGVSPIIGRRNRTHYIPLNKNLEVKPLHKSLMRSKRKLWPRSADTTDSTWNENIKRCDDKKSYSIQISKRHGTILNAFYLDFNLIIAQEQVISFWSQSALGNMLSAQNMWVSKGSVQRLVTDGNCIFKKSPQAVISLENSVAYVELWIKEHKSDKRQRPVADIFATIYFCRHHLNGPDKKVLQLENINGISSDVQYVVLRNSRNIIVSWCETCDDARKTYIHCYNLASDYQTVVSIREMGSVDHYLASLHNIEDCNTLVMGCGEHKVTLWNVEYGYVVATIEINDIRSEPSTLWMKCDRGFLFLLQFYELENMFKLIAINGIHHSWKRLKMFTFPSGYKNLRGVCLDNNILGAFYNNGIVCWNIQTGESVIEEMCSENVYIPSEKHIIILSENGILVRHALSHFITSYDL